MSKYVDLSKPYYVEKELGRGGFGVVYLGHQDNKEFILKEQTDVTTATHEYEILAKLTNTYHCQNVLCVYDYKYDELSGKFYIAMEYVKGTALIDEFFACWDENKCPDYVDLFYKIAKAVEVFHAINIAHLDLKPENIIIKADGSPIIIDFGISCVQTVSSLYAGQNNDEIACKKDYALGTIGYMAPEVPERNIVNFEKVDIFALGVIYFELLTQKYPYSDTFNSNFSTLIYTVDLPFRYGDKLKELILQMIELNPNKRPDIEEVVDTLEHIKNSF